MDVEDDWEHLDNEESTILTTSEDDGSKIQTKTDIERDVYDFEEYINDDSTLSTGSEVGESIHGDERTFDSVQQEQDHALPKRFNTLETTRNAVSHVVTSEMDHCSYKNLKGRTQLLTFLQTIQDGREKLAIALVEGGATPDAKDSYGSALTQAIRGGYEMLAIALVKGGANPDAKDSYGSALTQSIRGGYEILAIALVKGGADPDAKDSYGSALTQSIRGGYEILAIALVEQGANPDAKDSHGPAVTQAIRAGLVTLAKKLLEKGANPDVKDSYGPAVTQAIRGGYEILAIALVEQGANPDAKDSYGPAVTQAIRAGLVTLAKKLLEKDANPDAKDSYGPALTQSRRVGFAKLNNVLLERGAVAPPVTQRLSDSGRVTIDGNFPHGTRLSLSTANGGFIHIATSENHDMIIRNVSASSGSTQILGFLPNTCGA